MRRLTHLALTTAMLLAAAFPAAAQGGRRERRPDEAPSLGAVAPNFELRRLGHDETVRLSEVRKDQPVVLIFGSYT